MSKSEQKEQHEPDWAHRAKHISHKPEWVDYIPHELWELGEVFFPIPTGKKGYNYPHHIDEYRYEADSEILNAYFDAGCQNYGIVCAGDLIVVDIDELAYVEEIAGYLPETIYQITGSRSGIHLFYFCKGLNSRRTLYDVVLDERMHIGEIKADNNGYVVGPKSKHPSGNRYGPLKGDEIASIDKDNILAAISDYLADNINVNENKWDDEYDQIQDVEIHELYEISADEVAPWLETENRIAHPIHGSSTYKETGGKLGNFMKNTDGTFVCWRCQLGSSDGCVLSGIHMLAMEKAHEKGELGGGDYACEWIRRNWDDDPRLHYYAWKKAIEDGLIKTYRIPPKVIKGYCIDNDIIELGENMTRDQYFETLNILEWDMVSEQNDYPIPDYFNE